MIRVLVVDDHPVVRGGVRALLALEPDVTVVAESSTVEDTLRLAESTKPDVIILDLTLADGSGLDVLARLPSVSPRTRAVVLSMHATGDVVHAAIAGGARGYVVKGAGMEDLMRAVRCVAGGGTFIPVELSAAADLAAASPPLGYDRLTPRERQVLRGVAAGRTNREMGAAFGLSAKTVDVHRTNLMRKLGVHDAQALARLAVRLGLVDG